MKKRTKKHRFFKKYKKAEEREEFKYLFSDVISKKELERLRL